MTRLNSRQKDCAACAFWAAAAMVMICAAAIGFALGHVLVPIICSLAAVLNVVFVGIIISEA